MKRFESSPSYSAHNASGKNDILPANNKSGPHSTIPSEQPKSNTFHLKSNKYVSLAYNGKSMPSFQSNLNFSQRSGQVVSNKDLFDKDPSGKDPSGKDPINVVPGMAGDDFTGDWYQHWK
ncbi:uncharacterized protein MELLADRAFT_101832 [Melampsora larici-populina 98AG31]|uniref:Uncharacterized protein n=1 Tax=Melampsora larici-populina (strain 98AG31 / pathotype 3-4-7) TaxID=747676 RepID=F4R520_MELLP|nr:uncharacterized protein MELLADRAFT_101832 [Melampsora larici-populina 98AG31]EGG12350.1 hypothetical protein MELLADRAFT_101832 [Melampsora larici-populina 98AG31]